MPKGDFDSLTGKLVRLSGVSHWSIDDVMRLNNIRTIGQHSPNSIRIRNESESEMFIRSVDPGTPAESISGRCRRGHQNNYMMIKYRSG